LLDDEKSTNLEFLTERLLDADANVHKDEFESIQIAICRMEKMDAENTFISSTDDAKRECRRVDANNLERSTTIERDQIKRNRI
jgi:hypothetical protein